MSGDSMSSKSNPEERFYCCGFWNVLGNKKNSRQHYEFYLPKTLDMIAGSNLRFFSDDAQIIKMVGAMCEERQIFFDPELMPQENLPGWHIAARLVKSCANMELKEFARPPEQGGEKGEIHYWRDLNGSGVEAYRSILAIWMSKVELTTSLAAEGGEKRMAAWIDVSVSRFNGERENYNFHRISTPRGKLSHYASDMRFFGTRLPLNASFLSADAATWSRLQNEFDCAAERAAKMPYGHDEETILADCLWRLPDSFHCIGKPLSQKSLRQKSKRSIWSLLR